MLIKFKLGEFDDIEEKYDELLGEVDYSDTEEQNGVVFSVKNYRIVIPAIESSFRYAVANVRNEDEEGEEAEDIEDADDEWEVESDCYLTYDENEKDINKWKRAITDSLFYSVYNIADKKGYSLERTEKLNCYIDTSEFLPSEDDPEIKPEEWVNKVKEEYPKLLEALDEWNYTIRYEPTELYDGFIYCNNLKGRLIIRIGTDNFYFSYDENLAIGYEAEYKADRDDKTVLDNIISTIVKFMNGEMFFVRGFVRGTKLKGIAFDFSDIRGVNEKYLELIKESLPADFNWKKKIEIKHYFI